MMLDKNTLDKLLKLPDDSLIAIINKIAAERGIDIKDLNITREQLNSLRSALSSADEHDIARASEIIKGFSENQNK